MKKYDNYKDSGIEWIGEIPSHWNNTRIKFTVKEKDSLFIDGDWIESKVITASGIRYITTGNVKVGQYSEQGNGYISEQTFHELNCTEVYEGDLIISRLNYPIGRACIIPNLNSRIVTSVDNVIYRPDNSIDKRYLLYLFSSKEYFEHTELISRGATMQRISRGMLGNLKIPLPELYEQNIISKYLDLKTSQIDDLIAKKERLIQLLEEERTAIINQAVTKGLDPNVPMKDSGIEWLGEIPQHWKYSSLKWYSKIYSGGTPSKDIDEYWINGTIPWLNSGCVNQWDITEVSEYITEEAFNKSSAKWIPPKSLVIALAGQGKTKGMVAQVQFETTCNQSLGVIVPNEKIYNRFLQYWLKNNYFNIRSLGGDKRDGLNLVMIGGIPIPIPLFNEQVLIANFLDNKNFEFDTFIQKSQQEIELLKEYKTALISEVVTGKVDVRNEKIN